MRFFSPKALALLLIAGVYFTACRPSDASLRTGTRRLASLGMKGKNAVLHGAPIRSRTACRAQKEPGIPSEKAPLRIVITGASKGLGRAMAEKFIKSGDHVLIASRSQNRVDATVQELSDVGPGRAFGTTVDVTDASQLKRLSDEADQIMGGVDMWICNAASNGYMFRNLVDTPPETLAEISSTNVLGTLLTAKQAIKSMSARTGPGCVVLLEGAGTSGEPTAKYAAYGLTKAGMKQLALSLQTECSGTELQVVTLNPGLVDTDLLRSGADIFGDVGNFIVNVFVNPPEVVAAEVVPQLRDVVNQKREDTSINNSVLDKLWSLSLLVQSNSPITISVITPKNVVHKLAKLIKSGGPLAQVFAQSYLEKAEMERLERAQQMQQAKLMAQEVKVVDEQELLEKHIETEENRRRR